MRSRYESLAHQFFVFLGLFLQLSLQFANTYRNQNNI